MFLLRFFSRYSGAGLLSGTERKFSVTTNNLLQWHWAHPLADNYGSILLHLGFFLISPESHYLMPVTISQALILLASAKSQVQHSGLIGSWLTRGEKIKLCNEGSSSDTKEMVYYFKITDRAQGSRAEGVKTYVCHVPITNKNYADNLMSALAKNDLAICCRCWTLLTAGVTTSQLANTHLSLLCCVRGVVLHSFLRELFKQHCPPYALCSHSYPVLLDVPLWGLCRQSYWHTDCVPINKLFPHAHSTCGHF